MKKKHKVTKLNNGDAIFEDLHLDLLNQWIERGSRDEMPEEILEYLDQLDKARGWYNSLMTEEQIIKRLLANYPDLDRIKARNRFYDAINFFYLDNHVKKEAYANIYANKLDNIATAIIRSAENSDDYSKAVKAITEAARIRGVYEKEQDKLPKELFDKPNKVYTMNPEDLGLPAANRNELARQIEAMNITEEQAIKIKQDAGLEPRKIFTFHEQKKED
ncbi:hypothetical protein [Aquimarina megaterium]|uniref:hypothetical protein n=1 Tax=Aquimarina megaterium TaxID=1443666 RepID=UPI0009438A70|nr:hypothetical protein [Aquimarina megaterium]